MGSSLQTLIRDLHRRRARERRSLALAEGVRLLEEALAAGAVRGAVISPSLEATSRGRALKAALERTGAPVEPVSERELEALADTEHPQGVVAVIEPRAWSWRDIQPGPGGVVLALAGVQDPGNVGTILRTAWALGAGGVVALKGTAELYNPKVLRGSMGALFRLPAVAGTEEELLAWAAERGAELWVATAAGEPVADLPGRSARPPVALALGNEGAGVPESLAARAARRVAVPLASGAESLNVAVAAGILLYEMTRAR